MAKRQRTRRPVAQRVDTARAAAERTLELVRQGLEAQGYSGQDVTNHRAYVDAATILNFVRDAGEHFAQSVAMQAPVDIELKVGDWVLGHFTQIMWEKRFGFAQITYIIGDDNQMRELRAHERVSDLHVNAKCIPEGEVMTSAVEDGDLLVFEIVAADGESPSARVRQRFADVVARDDDAHAGSSVIPFPNRARTTN